MRSLYSTLAALALIPAATLLGACDDPFGGVDPVLRADSIVLSSANTTASTRPSAIDIANNVRLTRPERPTEAGLFDLQVRQSGSVFSLVPSPPGGTLRGAGLQRTTGSTLENPGEAPREVEGYERDAQPVAVGDRWFVQTRAGAGGCGTTSKYALLQVVAADPATGLITLKIISNQSCDDERLEF
ncbi:MAG TPA: hypothetical protein VFS20_04260 [Longimicrobium sp.]|nr:hypothetical protein [Longimicrobium sp.]